MDSPSPKPQVPRRSYSLPVAKPTAAQDQDIEVLYALPYVRIIAFTTSSNKSRPSSSNSSSAVEEPEAGTLSWVSKYERTLAVGAFRIYRAPGSVAFLNCQNALKPILPKSQAWCVDGDSKFVLQIRPPQYWRIEVPNKTPDEIARVEELKKVLGEVLRFEKTPCPFQRHFTVELPEPQTPVKKKPWKPVDRPQLEISPLPRSSSAEHTPVGSPKLEFSSRSSSPFRQRPDQSPIRVESLIAALEKQSPQSDRIVQEPEEVSSSSVPETLPENSDKISIELEDEEAITGHILGLSLMEPSVAELIYEASITPSEDGDSFSDDAGNTPTNCFHPTPQPMEVEETEVGTPQPLKSLDRSMTAPPVLFVGPSVPLKQRSKSPSPLRCSTTITESGSDISSSDSYHSVHSWHSPLAPPSPPASAPSSPISYPFPLESIVLPKRLDDSQPSSAITITPTPGAWGPPDAEVESLLMASPTSPKTPPLVDDQGDKSEEEQLEISTPLTVKATVRHRTTTSSNSHLRELSPLPPAETLFAPRRRRKPRKLQTARHLPTAIIQKTYEILISPPSHLFQIMLNIASKIASGEWRGMIAGYGEPVQWDFEDEYGEDAFEDDYGISLPNPPRPRAKRSSSAVTGGSWEVD